MAKLIFLHGLNTFNDDLLHVGPMHFGSMHERLEAGFRARGVDFVGLTGLGSGSPEKQASTAVARILELGLLNHEIDENEDLHLLGHSVGGLVARVLATHPKLKPHTKSVITFGTPHWGALVAELGANFHLERPHLARALAAVGYDTFSRAETFRHFSREEATDFNRRFPPNTAVREVSLVCEVSPGQVCWPLRVLYPRLHPRQTASGGRPPSDGFIWSESQKYGESCGPFALDHFAEVGFFPFFSAAHRARSGAEFNRLLDFISKIIAK